MRFDRRKALVFGVSFLPLFAVALWLYPRVLPSWERAVLLLSGPALARFSPPLSVELDDAGGMTAYVHQPDGARKPLFTHTYQPYVIFLSLALLPALLAATPLSLAGRLRLVLIGIALLYVVHVVTVIAVFHVSICLVRTPGHTGCTWLRGILLTSGQITGFAGWGLLTWRFWLPGQSRGGD
jgi:hypothetical protein